MKKIAVKDNSVIARSYKMTGIKAKIAEHFGNDVCYITLATGAYNNWWVYNGSIFKADHMVVFESGKYHFIKGASDFRYGTN